MNTEKIVVLIPAHNEEKTIGKLISQVKKIIPKVYVVDDGSTDNTSPVAQQNGAIVIRHQQCLGKGAALKTGFNHIQDLQFDVVLTMDGDGQHSVLDLPVFLDAIEKKKMAGIIVGKRTIKGTNMPFIRRITNLSMSILISLLALQWIPDSQNGFRAIRTNVLKGMPLVTCHFETETEILLRASWKGVKIASVPVSTIYNNEKSKIKPTKDTINFFSMLLKLCFFVWKRK
ncbi:MAG: glycosyltransferase family 2 protein [Candidatus Omnitrophica bacterium]|nr:glycosyltransferase family 2 protein [Candidatus Omnitrophota bacterium]